MEEILDGLSAKEKSSVRHDICYQNFGEQSCWKYYVAE